MGEGGREGGVGSDRENGGKVDKKRSGMRRREEKGRVRRTGDRKRKESDKGDAWEAILTAKEYVKHYSI